MLDEPRIFPIIPVDMAKQRQFKNVDVPQPSIEHTLTACDMCGADGWIGPAQLAAVTFGGGTRLCYWCLFRSMDKGDPYDMEIVGLDATADQKPRRT